MSTHCLGSLSITRISRERECIINWSLHNLFMFFLVAFVTVPFTGILVRYRLAYHPKETPANAAEPEADACRQAGSKELEPVMTKPTFWSVAKRIYHLEVSIWHRMFYIYWIYHSKGRSGFYKGISEALFTYVLSFTRVTVSYNRSSNNHRQLYNVYQLWELFEQTLHIPWSFNPHSDIDRKYGRDPFLQFRAGLDLSVCQHKGFVYVSLKHIIVLSQHEANWRFLELVSKTAPTRSLPISSAPDHIEWWRRAFFLPSSVK